ncbi:Transposase (pseudogene), family 8 [Zobellia galactanivorans]|nr:Transposase (pseudogene), family 8 [Zobellia galactanivorans]
MDLRAVLPCRHTSKRNKEHKTYPYPLRNLEITRATQVWATDITYIPMRKE